MKTILTYLLLCMSLGHLYAQHAANAPVIAPENDYPLLKLLDGYSGFYQAAEPALDTTGTDGPDLNDAAATFRNLFAPGAQMALDFPVFPGDAENGHRQYKQGDLVGFDTYYDLFGASLGNLFTYVELKPTNTLIKCQGDHEWNVWIEKIFAHRDPQQGDKPVSTIVRVTFRKTTNNEYKIVSVVKEDKLPLDKDNDYIADTCDRCHSMLSTAEDRPAISARGCEVKSLYRKQPASKVTVAISGGIISVVNNEIKEKDISPTDIVMKPGYFNKAGLMLDVNATYTFSAFTALRAGCFYTRNAMDEDGMSKTINDYMAQYNSGSHQTVRFEKTSKKLYIPYLGLRVGNFYNAKNIISVEGILGLAKPANSSNQFKYAFENLDLEQVSSYTSQFKAKMFPMYGVRLSYEISIKEGLGRIAINASYLTGKYSYSNGSASGSSVNPNNIETPNQIVLPTGNRILFEGSQVHMLNFSVGFVYNVWVPGIRKEQERYFKLINQVN